MRKQLKYIFWGMFLIFGCSEGVTPLMQAAKSGDIPELKKLILNGARVNQKSRYGWTALIFASMNGHEEAVNILIDSGADLNVITIKIPSKFLATSGGYHSTTALAEAMTEGHLSIANILIDHGAKLDPHVLAVAGSQGDISILEKMRERGADFNKPGKVGYHPSPLWNASRGGQLDNVKWLLKNGADPNLIVHRTTALSGAVKGNHPEVVRLLLDNGADPNLIYASYKTTAIHDAVFWTPDDTPEQCRNSLRSIGILLSKGANQNYKEPGNDQTVLEALKMRVNNSRHKLNNTDYDQDVRQRILNGIKCNEAKIRLLQE